MHRNFFGAQIHSFETNLPSPPCLPSGEPHFRAMFIRAPAIMDAGPSVDVLSSYELTPEERLAQA